ncbi:MAG: hypothetical protein NTV51_13070 [Verrucomicrobia bacterium]|nr:hypothetical protein [Verrucomicrobiota bacterium]
MFTPRLLRLPFALGALLLAFAGSLDAQTVVYSNLVTSGNAFQTWTGASKLAQSFTPTASGPISSVTLNLTMSSTSVPVYAVEVWSDNGAPTHLPSTLLATLVSGQPWSALYTGTPAVYNASNTITFSSGSYGQNYSLSSDTAYWLVVTSSSGSAKAWGISATASAPTASFSSPGGVWGSTSLGGALGAEISVTAIPEPSTYAALAGLSALGLVVYQRRRLAAARQRILSETAA